MGELPKLEVEKLTLFHFESCPFCMRVRSVIEELGLDIKLADTLVEPARGKELLEGGGKSTVPCLRMELPDGSVHWQYESSDIIEYLQSNFS